MTRVPPEGARRGGQPPLTTRTAHPVRRPRQAPPRCPDRRTKETVSDQEYETAPYPDWDEPGPGHHDSGIAGPGTWTLEDIPDGGRVPGAHLPPAIGWGVPGGTRILSAADEPAGIPAADQPATAVPAPRRARRVTFRRSPLRLLTITTLILVSAAAAALITAPASHPLAIIPADNPGATQPAPAVASGSALASSPASAAATAPATTGPAAAATAADPPAITRAAAEAVLAAYWQVNSTANQERSASTLAGIETGSSYQLDTGQYRASLAASPDSSHYIPFTTANPVFLIPREPSGTYPRWWAVRVTYAGLASPDRTVPGSGYIVFTKAGAGAPWKNTLEPYVPPGSSTPTPFARTDAHGYAVQQDPADGTGLSLAPEALPALTAGSLDETSGTIASPGDLADQKAQAVLQDRLPGAQVTDTHSASGTVYALKTYSGVLVFFSLTARVTITAPSGQAITGISIPGYLSPGQQTTASTTLTYTDQFAIVIPSGSASPYIVADASGITGQS